MLCSHRGSRVVLDFLEDAEETDAKVCTIHNEANEDEGDQCNLVIANLVARLALPAAEVGDVRRRGTGYLIVPGDGRSGCAADDGGEVVIETERESGRPGADEHSLR